MRSITCFVLLALSMPVSICAGETPNSDSSTVDPNKELDRVWSAALAKGIEPKIEDFNRIARVFKISAFEKGDIVREFLMDDESGYRFILIRIRERDGRRDIILTDVRQVNDIRKALFYITSPEGSFSILSKLRPGFAPPASAPAPTKKPKRRSSTSGASGSRTSSARTLNSRGTGRDGPSAFQTKPAARGASLRRRRLVRRDSVHAVG